MRLPYYFYPTLALLLSLHLAAASPAGDKVDRDDGIVSTVTKRMTEIYGDSATLQNAFVGTDACLACHTGYKDFKLTAHHAGLKMIKDDRYSL